MPFLRSIPKGLRKSYVNEERVHTKISLGKRNEEKMPERVLRNSSYLNSKSTTGTNTRVRDVSCTSGMCPICIRDCPFLCEISLSAFRGREALYPEPVQYGFSTAGALKDFGLDWSHFNIQSSLFEVHGIEPIQMWLSLKT